MSHACVEQQGLTRQSIPAWNQKKSLARIRLTTSAALLLLFLMVFLATTCPLQISSGGRSTMLGSPTLFFSRPCVRGRRAGENGISGLASTDLECSSTVWNLLHDMAKLSRLLGVVVVVAVVAPSCGVSFDASLSFFPFCCFDSA